MRRHVIPVAAVNFDTRARILSEEIRPEWEETIKKQHRENYSNLVASLSIEFGPVALHRKIEDFKAIGVLPFSIVSHHNEYLLQIRSAFVQGLYYPALTAACALGERIINHLILDLRDDYHDRPSHTKVAGRASIDKWQQALHVLGDWDVLVPEAAQALKKLEGLRNRSLHFSPATYRTLRDDAIRSIALLSSCIEAQFSAFGRQPWFIEGTAGACFIKADWEQVPFIRKYYLPICPAVGVRYTYSFANNKWLLFDYKDYEDRAITDAEFRDLFNGRNASSLAPTTVPPADGIVCYDWVRKGDAST